MTDVHLAEQGQRVELEVGVAEPAPDGERRGGEPLALGASRVNGAWSSVSHPCAAHSSTPSSRRSARAIHPLAAAMLPWTVPWRNASQRASSAASARMSRRRYAANARLFNSIARAYWPWKWAAWLRPSSTSAVSPVSPAFSNRERARSQSAAASASRPLRSRSSAVSASITAMIPRRVVAPRAPPFIAPLGGNRVATRRAETTRDGRALAGPRSRPRSGDPETTRDTPSARAGALIPRSKVRILHGPLPRASITCRGRRAAGRPAKHSSSPAPANSPAPAARRRWR